MNRDISGISYQSGIQIYRPKTETLHIKNKVYFSGGLPISGCVRLVSGSVSGGFLMLATIAKS